VAAPVSGNPRWDGLKRGGRNGQGQEAESVEEILVSVAGADGVAVLASRAACQRSGRRSPSCSAGVVGKRVSTSCRYAHGSTPNRWHEDVKLKSTAAARATNTLPIRSRTRSHRPTMWRRSINCSVSIPT